jgi:hypothetical protein
MDEQREIIDEEWNWMINYKDEPIVRRTAVLAATYPCLRRLFPFASLKTSGSHGSRYPYNWNLPHIECDAGHIRAIGHDKSILLEGELEEVVARVAQAMDELFSKEQ